MLVTHDSFEVLNFQKLSPSFTGGVQALQRHMASFLQANCFSMQVGLIMAGALKGIAARVHIHILRWG